MSSVYDIQGRNCLFQLLIGDTYLDVVCAKTFSINVTTEMKETTSSQSGFWKEKRPRKLSYVINFNGAVQVVAESDKPTVKTMLVNQTQFLPFNYRLLYYDNSNNLMGITGQLYVSNTVIDSNPINLLNGTVELEGNGAIEVIDQLPDLANITITSTGDGSIAGLFQFKLINTDGEIIFDSGRLPEASGGNLSHPASAIGQVTKGSYYIFWQVQCDSVNNQFTTDAPPGLTSGFASGTNNENTFGAQVYDFTADRNVTFALGIPEPPPGCVAPAIIGSPSLPNGTLQVGYFYSFIVSGTETFTLDNITKPSWMTISVLSGNIITFSGSPDTVATGVSVSVRINNACGNVTFSDTFDVADNPDLIDVSWSFDEQGSAQGTFRIAVNGSVSLLKSADDSGVLPVNPGDVVEASIFGVSAFSRTLTVVSSISGTIFTQTSNSSTISFTWTAQSGHDYTVTAITN